VVRGNRPPPILVTGSHRSGTTWVGRVLACAPGVGYLDEPFRPDHRPGVLATPIADWFPYIRPGTDGRIVGDVRRTLSFDYGLLRELRAVASARDVARMGRDAGRFALLRARRARPLWKDPLAVLSVPWLADTFGMDVVVMIRHPAAFASSLKRLGWTHDFSHFLRQPGLVDELFPAYRDRIEDYAARPPGVVDQAILLWNVIHTVIAGYRRDRPDWTYLRHEDVSARPDTEFRALFERVGLPYTPRAIRLVAETTSGGNPAEARAGVIHQLRRDSAANVANWRTRLEPAEIERVRAGTAAAAAPFYGDTDW
jgi:hypothetical protein